MNVKLTNVDSSFSSPKVKLQPVNSKDQKKKINYQQPLHFTDHGIWRAEKVLTAVNLLVFLKQLI